MTAPEMIFFCKNHKIHTIEPEKESRYHERTQNTKSSEKSQQLETQTDIKCLQHGQISTPVSCYEIANSRKEELTSPNDVILRMERAMSPRAQ
jgi:hypothetical protein